MRLYTVSLLAHVHKLKLCSYIMTIASWWVFTRASNNILLDTMIAIYGKPSMSCMWCHLILLDQCTVACSIPNLYMHSYYIQVTLYVGFCYRNDIYLHSVKYHKVSCVVYHCINRCPYYIVMNIIIILKQKLLNV